jgi:uncharacterized iron-regulated protein
MKKFILSIVVIFFYCQINLAQTPKAYRIYDAEGKKSKLKKMFKAASDADIILFGELHNNPIAHWLQYELTARLGESSEMVLAAEMFEADNQEAVDLYLSGDIDDKGLDTMARLWSNYNTDYAQLLNYAKEKEFPFIASNIPRRYASMVFRNGFEILDSLESYEKAWIAPLPIAYDPDLPGYKNMLEMMPGHGGENLPKAQAIKDATMAYFILENYQEGKKLIHYNGSYHSDFYEGILWYLKRKAPAFNYMTISTVVQEDVAELEEDYIGKADFIIVVDENVTTSY